MTSALTRRQIIKSAAGVGAAGLLLTRAVPSLAATTGSATTGSAATASRPRVAVVGGGSGGVAAASTRGR